MVFWHGGRWSSGDKLELSFDMRPQVVHANPAVADDRGVGLLKDSILTDLIRRGKVKKHEAVINRLIAQYRS